MIDIFDSSDLGSKLADTIAWSIARDVPREEARTHGGLWLAGPGLGPFGQSYQVTTFEHRIRCGFYPQQDYTRNPMMTYNVWEPYRAPSDIQLSAFMLTRRSWEGRWYNAKQAIRIGTNALWLRAGVRRDMPLSIRGVCTEVVWYYVDLLGSDYQALLRDEYDGPDAFTPMTQKKMCVEHPELWRLKPHVACGCYHCRRGG
jgi:hypothetical protein